MLALKWYPWQLTEEHSQAPARQAEEHHSFEEEKDRESSKLPSQAEKRREWRKWRHRPWHQCSDVSGSHRQAQASTAQHRCGQEGTSVLPDPGDNGVDTYDVH